MLVERLLVEADVDGMEDRCRGWFVNLCWGNNTVLGTVCRMKC
jgi:hypothetical protein